MSKYAPVAPVEILLQIKERNMLQGYMLLLAHDVVQKPDKYAQLMHKFEGTVILDNSLIELGHPAPVDTMLAAAAITKPTFVVLPDVLNEREETVRLATDAINTWFKRLPPETGAMIAAQGNSPEDALWCVDEIIGRGSKQNCKVDKVMVGVPREVANKQGSRAKLVQLLVQAKYQVHLLGMSNCLSDDLMCAKLYGVQGIDSASPLRAGWEGKRYDGYTDWMRPREEYFEQCKGFSMDMCYNMATIQAKIGE